MLLGVIGALGGGGVIVLGLPSFIGKLWAESYARQSQQKHDRDLERLKADFEVWKTKTVGAHEQKLTTYQEVANILASWSSR